MVRRLRHRGEILRCLKKQDAGGGYACEDWQSQGKVWFSLTSLRLSERFRYHTLKAENLYSVIVRSPTKIRVRDHLVWRGRVLRVLANTEEDELGRFLHCLCEQLESSL